jgi:hypothetical protein
MEDELITLATAKLIPNPKKTDYWNNCQWYWVDTYHKDGYRIGDRNTLDIDYPRPTQSLLQRWLREVYNINVEVCYWESDKKWQSKIKTYFTVSVTTYEEALEVGLQEALKLIPLKQSF